MKIKIIKCFKYKLVLNIQVCIDLKVNQHHLYSWLKFLIYTNKSFINDLLRDGWETATTLRSDSTYFSEVILGAQYSWQYYGDKNHSSGYYKYILIYILLFYV